MITFFTTTKDFNDKNLVNQVNAIKSWVEGKKGNCEIILFNSSKGSEILKDIPNIIFCEEIDTNENGVPFINKMFYKASDLATNEIVCFLNADIIISGEFVDYLLDIHKKEKINYLIVGQRIDTDFDYLIDFKKTDWYTELVKSEVSTSKIHPPLGSDFFVFPKGQYKNGSLPDLLVGRPGWDNYMIYDSRRKNFKLINLSPSYMVIHQNHDYTHKSTNDVIKNRDDDYNYNFLPENEKYTYILDYCNYKYVDRKIKKTFHNNNFKLYYYHECIWGKASITKRISLKFRLFVMRILFKQNI